MVSGLLWFYFDSGKKQAGHLLIAGRSKTRNKTSEE
jgi:hypothetical protein